MINFLPTIIFPLQDKASVIGHSPFMAFNLPIVARYLSITGTTLDSTGAVLGSCVVDVFRTSDDVRVDAVVSDAAGLYESRGIAPGINHYAVAYKAGSPDVAGTTVNTLTGSGS